MFALPVFAACLYCLFILPVYIACLYRLLMLYVFAVNLYCDYSVKSHATRHASMAVGH
jgi:hypothetical protein